ncbi:hypothetical protein GW916_06515 [bacterium]|nr:hypothetical protein [bacterium]
MKSRKKIDVRVVCVIAFFAVVLSSSHLVASSSKSIKASETTYSAITLAAGADAKSATDEVFIGRLDYYESQENRSFLFYYNLKTGKKKSIDLPVDLQSRSLLSLFPHQESPHKVYVLSQIHKAGADFPRVDLYDLDKDNWLTISEEIDCVNFSGLSVVKAKLSMTCGEDYLHPPKKPTVVVSLPNALPSIMENTAYKLEFLEKSRDINVKLLKSGKSLRLAPRLK